MQPGGVAHDRQQRVQERGDQGRTKPIEPTRGSESEQGQRRVVCRTARCEQRGRRRPRQAASDRHAAAIDRAASRRRQKMLAASRRSRGEDARRQVVWHGSRGRRRSIAAAAFAEEATQRPRRTAADALPAAVMRRRETRRRSRSSPSISTSRSSRKRLRIDGAGAHERHGVGAGRISSRRSTWEKPGVDEHPQAERPRWRSRVDVDHATRTADGVVRSRGRVDGVGPHRTRASPESSRREKEPCERRAQCPHFADARWRASRAERARRLPSAQRVGV